MRNRRADLARLWFAATLTACVYALMLVYAYPLLGWYDVPLLDLGKLAGFGVLHAVALVCGYVLVFAFYLVAWRAASRLSGRHAAIAVMGAGILFSLILIWAYPVGANDIYDYIFRARLWGLYDYNPLTVTPLQVNDDPWFPYVVWVWFASPYGPFWADVSVLVYRLAGDSLLANLLLFKLLAILCAAGISALLFDLLRERDEGEALGAVLLFAWNPLLLFETAVNGHNDIVMMLLLVAALWLYRREWLWAALMLATLAALVKLAAVVALPVLLVAGAQRLWAQHRTPPVRVLMASLGCCLLAALVVYAPLWQGAQTFAGLWALDNRFTASPAAIVKLVLEQGVGREPAEWLARNLFTTLFLGAFLAVLRRAARAQASVPRTLLAAVALLLTLGTLWFQPWYLIWLIALGPLAGERWRRLAVVWSASALSVYLLFDFGWYWFPDFFNGGNGLVLNVTAVTIWLAPPALWLAADRVRQARAPGQRRVMAR